MTLMKGSWSVRTCYTMCIRYVGNDIRDRQLERECLLYVYKTIKQGCVDRLNTEGGRGSVSWLICVGTCKGYARRAKLCLGLAYS